MRFNHGSKHRAHLDAHFLDQLQQSSENNKRPLYLSHQEFQFSKKATLRGKSNPSLMNFADAEIIPYSDESTLCVVCSQRIEIEQLDNSEEDLVFKDAKNVTIEGKQGIAHL